MAAQQWADMNTRIFGKTGRVVGEVGLGCWQIGGNWGEVSDDTALSILRTTLELGTTFYDTADVYGGGRSETLIGKFLRDTKARDRLFIANKAWSSGRSRLAAERHPGDRAPAYRGFAAATSGSTPST